jgi:hypothetical protein
VKSPAVKEIRGRGLLIGVQVKPEYGNARGFCEKFMAEGILCKDAHEDVIRFAPPLIIKKDEIDWAMDRINHGPSKPSRRIGGGWFSPAISPTRLTTIRHTVSDECARKSKSSQSHDLADVCRFEGTD